MLIKHLNKKEIETLMKVGKNIPTPSFLFKFTLETLQTPKKPYLSTYFISALSPKAQFKKAVNRNNVRRRIYGAINRLQKEQNNLILRAIIIPNKNIDKLSPKELETQILNTFNKIGV